MDISVVIPVFNREHYIERAILSVLNQSRAPQEIIVVDDGSTDNTPRILQKYNDRLRIITQENKGVSAARNKGIEAASGTWISLLDSDDEWLPDKLKHAGAFHENNPHYRIFQSDEIWIRNGRRVNPKKKHAKKAGRIFIDSLALCLISPSAVLFEKSLWEEAGRFDPAFPVCEDYDLWLRITKREEVGLDTRPLTVKYGGHKDQLSRSYPRMDAYRVQAMARHLDDETLTDEEWNALTEQMVRKLNILITGAQKRGRETLPYWRMLQTVKAARQKRGL
ncbi:MAG: glycosyltransferase [Calditrichaeota bacterium]|nr:MAG: glycosyltransferase [Calditrichota bacterium]